MSNGPKGAAGGSFGSPLSRLFAVLVCLAAAAAPARAAQPPAASRKVLISRAERALHEQRYTAAADLYRRAAAMDPRADDAPQMAAVAAFLEQYGRARRDLARSMSRDLSPEDRDLGSAHRELQDEAAGTPAAADPDSFGANLRTTMGGGFDDNPHRSGTAEVPSEVFGGLRPGAAFGTATLETAIYGSPQPGLELELDYTLDQVAYSDRRLADLAYQDQALELGMALALGNSARLIATLSGELSLTGVGTALSPFSRALRADGELVLGTGMVQLRLGGGYQATEVYDRDLAFLSGGRLEARATPVLDVGGWRASLTARLRADAVGSDRGEPTEADLPLCEACTTATVIPHSNRTVALSARLTAPWRWPLRPGLWARAERRTYDTATRQESASGETSLRYAVLGDRATTTAAAGATLRLRVTRRVSLTARWDYTRFEGVFRPASPDACAVDDGCGRGALSDRKYHKQAVGLQLDIQWL